MNEMHPIIELIGPYIPLAMVISFFVLGYTSLWRFGHKGAWGKLAREYRSNKNLNIKSSDCVNRGGALWYRTGTFWKPFNNLSVAADTEGLSLSGGIFMRMCMPDIFIPNKDIRVEGRKRVLFVTRDILSFSNSEVRLAIAGYTDAVKASSEKNAQKT